MKLTTGSFSDGGRIPDRFTCEGEDLSPALGWTDPPEGTRSFALLVVDPDAPSGTFTHWVLFDLPAGRTELPRGASGVGRSGRNDFGRRGWGGPCPPPGHGEHRYVFRLLALDLPSLGLDEGAGREELERRAEGHVLGEAELTGRYGREAR